MKSPLLEHSLTKGALLVRPIYLASLRGLVQNGPVTSERLAEILRFPRELLSSVLQALKAKHLASQNEDTWDASHLGKDLLASILRQHAEIEAARNAERVLAGVNEQYVLASIRDDAHARVFDIYNRLTAAYATAYLGEVGLIGTKHVPHVRSQRNLSEPITEPEENPSRGTYVFVRARAGASRSQGRNSRRAEWTATMYLQKRGLKIREESFERSEKGYADLGVGTI